MIIPFTELPKDVQLDFCFGYKQVIKSGFRYVEVAPPGDGSPAQYEITYTTESDGNAKDPPQS